MIQNTLINFDANDRDMNVVGRPMHVEVNWNGLATCSEPSKSLLVVITKWMSRYATVVTVDVAQTTARQMTGGGRRRAARERRLIVARYCRLLCICL